VNSNKNHFADLTDDKDVIKWNRGLVAIAHMHYLEYILDKNYVPISNNNNYIYKEMQTLMFDLFKDHFQTEKGLSLVSQFEFMLDAQSIYLGMKTQSMSSKVEQLLGDMLLHSINTTEFPGIWCVLA
jgi:hypothetical protein